MMFVKCKVGSCDRLSIWYALVAVLVLTISISRCATAESNPTLEVLLSFEIPNVSALPQVYPDTENSALAQFCMRLHEDFIALASATDTSRDKNVLTAYATVRDDWLEGESLSKVILAGYITMGIDAYIFRRLPDMPDLSPEQAQKLRALASQNDLAAQRLFGAIDKALVKMDKPYRPLSEICDRSRVMPNKACWLDYIGQFGLSYSETSMGKVTLRFLDMPVQTVPEELLRYTMHEWISLDPVFILHSGSPSYLIQFASRVLDVSQAREIAWPHSENRGPFSDEKNRSREVARLLSAFAPAGERWLAREGFANKDETNVELFYNLYHRGPLIKNFFEPREETVILSQLRYYMRLIVAIE